MASREVKVTVLVQDEDTGTPAAYTVTQRWDRRYSLHDVLRAIIGRVRRTAPRRATTPSYPRTGTDVTPTSFTPPSVRRRPVLVRGHLRKP